MRLAWFLRCRVGLPRSFAAWLCCAAAAGCGPGDPPLISSEPARPQSGKACLRGKIVDGLDNPQSGCKVWIENAVGSATMATSDAGGGFTVELPPDQYTVTIEPPGQPSFIA